MCGIVGAVGFADRQGVAEAIEAMKLAVAHRGPDGEGTWLHESQPVAFGHRRLSIIDLSESANQPMASGDDRFVIAYNGELYNYLELREECVRLGSRFRTESDTEVILESYRHWGTDAFKRFKGMWAFALYDREAARVVFCRDPFGIKPLYYGMLDGALYFGSEPKALRAADSRFSDVDDVSERMFIESAVLDRGDWTFFSRIRRFPHAHFAIVDVNKVERFRFERYWSPPSTILSIDYREAVEELRRLLIQSVTLHLRSDVPVGSCLSGGIDSSAIVCIGGKQLGDDNHFQTFTTRYPNHPEIDESAWAQRIVDFAKSEPTWIEPRFEGFMEDFSRLVQSQDEPFGSTSIYAQYAIFQGIGKSGVKVVLDGQGADEQLAGYHGFIPYFMNDLVRRGMTTRYLKEIAAFKDAGMPQQEDHNALKKTLWKWPKRRIAIDPVPLKSFFADEYADRMKALQLPDASFEQTLLNLVVESNMPQLLRYEDRNSMAHSVESRVPFLEPELVSFILSLPAVYKIRNGFTKAVLRDALAGIIPDDVRLRRDKLGFPAPEVKWLERGFGLKVPTAGSTEWRQLVTDTWKRGLHEQSPTA